MRRAISSKIIRSLCVLGLGYLGLYLGHPPSALADLGRVAEAEAAFREEIRLFPEDPRAYASLALLLALTGRAPDAAATMRTMTEVSPTAQAYAEAVKVYRALHDEQGAQTVLRFARRKFPGSPALAGL